MECYNEWYAEVTSVLKRHNYTQEQIKSFPYWMDSFLYEMTPEEAVEDFGKWLSE